VTSLEYFFCGEYVIDLFHSKPLTPSLQVATVFLNNLEFCRYVNSVVTRVQLQLYKDVSGEHTASIFIAEDTTSVASAEDGGIMFRRNVDIHTTLQPGRSPRHFQRLENLRSFMNGCPHYFPYQEM
jgi:hypothetical protein